MSGSSGNKTTGVNTTTTQLPQNVQNAVDKSLAQSNYMFDNRGTELFKPNTNSMVVPYNSHTLAGMADAEGDANRSRPGFQAVFDRTAALGNSDGLNDGQRQALSQLQGIAGGEGQLGAFARGDYLDGSANPYFRDVVNQGVEAARDSVNLGAAGMGRTGSGVHQGVLAKETGNLASRMYADQYNNEVNNMFGALDKRMGAAGDVFNGYQQGQGNAAMARAALPAAYSGLQGLSAARMGVGSMWEDLNRRQLDDQARIQDEISSQGRKASEWFNAMASGAGQFGQTSTTTSQAPKTSPFMAGLGGAATGFGIGGPVGAAIGGGAGLLSGLF